ncbi:MAG: hypothetical protein OXQ32_06900 [bacterium]|nr:hypothetical protein [bacterium]
MLRNEEGRLTGAAGTLSETVPVRWLGADPRVVEILGRLFPELRGRAFGPFFFLAVFTPVAAFAAMRRISTSEPLTRRFFRVSTKSPPTRRITSVPRRRRNLPITALLIKLP